MCNTLSSMHVYVARAHHAVEMYIRYKLVFICLHTCDTSAHMYILTPTRKISKVTDWLDAVRGGGKRKPRRAVWVHSVCTLAMMHSMNSRAPHTCIYSIYARTTTRSYSVCTTHLRGWEIDDDTHTHIFSVFDFNCVFWRSFGSRLQF